MSALGQNATLQRVGTMSAYPRRADVRKSNQSVRFVPKADIRRSWIRAASVGQFGLVRRRRVLVSGLSERVLNDLVIFTRKLHRPELVSQLRDLAVEAERRLVVVVVH